MTDESRQIEAIFVRVEDASQIAQSITLRDPAPQSFKLVAIIIPLVHPQGKDIKEIL